MAAHSGTLRQLEYFVAAADLGTVTGAAESCAASQAAVSAALTELERTVGMQLLVRRAAKGVALTQGGERVLPIARRMIEDAEELTLAASHEQQVVAGPLRIACTAALSPRAFPALAERFAARHPLVRLELADGLASDMQDRVRQGTADACLLYRRQMSADLDATPVRVIDPYAVLPADHAHAGDSSISLAELSDEPLIIVHSAESSRVIEVLIEEAGLTPHPRWSLSSPETVRAMVAHGLGYSVFSGKAAGTETFDGQRVAYVRVNDVITPNEVVLATAPDRRMNARLEALASLLTEPDVQAAFG